MSENMHISLRGVGLHYDLHFDRTNTLKERVINAVMGVKYVKQKKGTLHALSDINLEIHHGERVGVIGLNGAGKSTLLKVLARLLKPTVGELVVQGTIQPLIEVGAGFNYEFSGRENIYLNGAMLGFSRAEMVSKEAEIIQFAEIGEFIDVPVKYYSSGMVVRLAFTIATIVRPEILLLDEMLSAGDIEFVAKAQKRIGELLDTAKILVIVSHDLNLVSNLATRLVILEAGRIVYDGAVKEGLTLYRQKAAPGNGPAPEPVAAPEAASKPVEALPPPPPPPIHIETASLETLEPGEPYRGGTLRFRYQYVLSCPPGEIKLSFCCWGNDGTPLFREILRENDIEESGGPRKRTKVLMFDNLELLSGTYACSLTIEVPGPTGGRVSKTENLLLKVRRESVLITGSAPRWE